MVTGVVTLRAPLGILATLSLLLLSSIRLAAKLKDSNGLEFSGSNRLHRTASAAFRRPEFIK
jgi:hypothetical protein